MFNQKVSFESSLRGTYGGLNVHFCIFFFQIAVSVIHVGALTISLMSLTNNDVL